MRASERPGSAQAPILFPPGELSVAKLQHEGGINRVEAGNARRSVSEIDLRASPCGIIDERHAERERSLLGSHTEHERGRVGLGTAPQVAVLTRAWRHCQFQKLLRKIRIVHRAD